MANVNTKWDLEGRELLPPQLAQLRSFASLYRRNVTIKREKLGFGGVICQCLSVSAEATPIF